MAKPWEYTYSEVNEEPSQGPWNLPWVLPDTPKTDVKPLTFGDQFIQGVMDPIHGGAQLLEQMSPAPVRDSINSLGLALSEYGIVSPPVEGGVSAQVAEREKEYNRRAAATPDIGSGMRIAGNVLSPANLGLAAAAGPSLGGRMLAGGAMSVLSPEEGTDDYLSRKLTDFGTGVVAGGVTHGMAKLLGKAISPQASTDADIKLLRREGVTPTLGQLLGPRASKGEEGLASAPILGGAIKEARLRTWEDFNKAAANRALSHVGEKLPAEGAPRGHQLMAHLDDVIGSKYNTLLPNLTGKADPAFRKGLRDVYDQWDTLPPTQRQHLKQVMDKVILQRFGSGPLPGEQLKGLESKLGQQARGYTSDADFDKRQLGVAIRDMQRVLRDTIERQNPQYAGELSNINKAWYDLLRLENASIRSVANDGIFSPAQMLQSLKRFDRSSNKRAFAQGTIPNQDLALAGQRKLGSTVADSGTPFRTALGLGVLGGGYLVHPGVMVGELALSMGPYTKTGQKALSSLLAGRPSWAEPLAGGLNKAAPYMNPAPLGALESLRIKDE